MKAVLKFSICLSDDHVVATEQNKRRDCLQVQGQGKVNTTGIAGQSVSQNKAYILEIPNRSSLTFYDQ